ncbi:hypothetical protein KW797_00415 [Candidatus Parcubacteria bacterium]|nr:hypothetical protein [Candidatus Parcubacteria bacterium]
MRKLLRRLLAFLLPVALAAGIVGDSFAGSDDYLQTTGTMQLASDTTVKGQFDLQGGIYIIPRGKKLSIEGKITITKDATLINDGLIVIGSGPGTETFLTIEPKIRTWTTQKPDDKWVYNCDKDGLCTVTHTGGYLTVQHSEEYTPSLGDVSIR